jgi:hypothetical protein
VWPVQPGLIQAIVNIAQAIELSEALGRKIVFQDVSRGSCTRG